MLRIIFWYFVLKCSGKKPPKWNFRNYQIILLFLLILIFVNVGKLHNSLVSRSLLRQCYVVPQYFCLCNAVGSTVFGILEYVYHWVLLWLIFKTSSEKQRFLENSKCMYVKCLYLVFRRSIWSNTIIRSRAWLHL